MKKLLIILIGALPFCAKAQPPSTVNIDTVYIRFVQMQLQDWCWFIGKTPDVFPDSNTAYQYRRIRTKVKTATPIPNPSNPNWTQSITIDSIPARVMVNFYGSMVNAPAGEITPRLVALKAEFNSKPRLAQFISPMTANGNAAYENTRGRGKRMTLDN